MMTHLYVARERSLRFIICLLLLMSVLFSCCLCSETDTLSINQSLVPGDTLVSKRGNFELGFFSPGNSTDLYIGIWYKSIPGQTVVWVANRDNPIRAASYNSSELRISGEGYLTLSFNSKSVRISNSSDVTEAVILDSGNFVLRNASETIWQSFDHPTDTWLPGANLGFGLFSAGEAKLVSWKSPNYPSTGSYSLGMSRTEHNEVFVSNISSSTRLWRSGVLPTGTLAYPNGQTHFNFTYGSRDDSDYVTFNNGSHESIVPRIAISFDGVVNFYLWSTELQQWTSYWLLLSDGCGTHATCGVNAMCSIVEDPRCACLAGFVPRDEQAWNSYDFSGGCIRRSPLSCNDGYGYWTVSDIKLPANSKAMEVRNSTICQFSCSDNCMCQAYAYNSQGSCLLFVGDILDVERIRNVNNSTGRELFVKVNDSTSSGAKKGKRRLLLPLVIILPIIALAIMICVFRICYLRRKSREKDPSKAYQDLLLLDLNSNELANGKTASQIEHEKNELPLFSFSSIVMATDNFAVEKMLGEGGFGPVYKGELQNGQFVAIKRLSRGSGQGLEEFKTEMELIAKLQHRNLVGILGCCIENDEKILIYEYMENKSLDFFLFDSNRKESLDWTRRVQIIEGVAQGLLYLHHYSRLRIIHRDLKASNILLDGEMNPKISDFGMARIFGGNNSQANTKRIVGTFGYMSPEYTMHGLFSVKSDVYAFGVLMLEIISGRKNAGFCGSEHLSLLAYAWNLWEHDRVLELIDPALDARAYSSDSITRRCIQIGLLCVQENASDRPLMSDVAAMLSNEQKELAMPKHPPFAVGSLTSEEIRICSVNELTLTSMEPR